MIHRIELTGDAGQYSVAGAVAIRFLAPVCLVDAARALRDAGAKHSDSIRANWAGTPINVTIGKVLAYTPSPARLSTERSGGVPRHFTAG